MFRINFKNGSFLDIDFADQKTGIPLLDDQFKDTNENRTYITEFNQEITQLFISSIAADDTSIATDQLTSLYAISAYFSHTDMMQKISRIAGERLELDKLVANYNDASKRGAERFFWRDIFYQKVFNFPVNEWEEKLRKIPLEDGIVLDALLNKLKTDDQTPDLISESVAKLKAYYLYKADSLGHLMKDYPAIVKKMRAIDDPAQMKNLFTGLIELTILCFKKQTRAVDPIHPHLPGGRLSNFINWIRENNPPRPLRDCLRAFQVIRQINKFESITSAFRDMAMEKLATQEAAHLRTRVEQLNLTFQYPWSLTPRAGDLNAHSRDCAKQMIAAVAHTVIAVVTMPFLLLAVTGSNANLLGAFINLSGLEKSLALGLGMTGYLAGLGAIAYSFFQLIQTSGAIVPFAMTFFLGCLIAVIGMLVSSRAGLQGAPPWLDRQIDGFADAWAPNVQRWFYVPKLNGEAAG